MTILLWYLATGIVRPSILLLFPSLLKWLLGNLPTVLSLLVFVFRHGRDMYSRESGCITFSSYQSLIMSKTSYCG